MLTSAFREQYPPQTGLYAVKVKEGDDWKKHSVCRLHVSVGQPYHEGAKFQATMAWALVRFSRVVVCVNDTLQATNMMFEQALSRTDSYLAAMEAGSEWIGRNQDVLDGAEIKRWDEWKSWPVYGEALRDVVQTYKSTPMFKDAVDQTAMGFWIKRRDNHPAYKDERLAEFMTLSRDYLLEEIAVICRMIEQERAIDIYPGTMLPVFDLMKRSDAPVMRKSLMERDFARIDFSRR